MFSAYFQALSKNIKVLSINSTESKKIARKRCKQFFLGRTIEIIFMTSIQNARLFLASPWDNSDDNERLESITHIVIEDKLYTMEDGIEFLL